MNIFPAASSYYVGEVHYPPGATLGPRVQRNLQLVYVWSGAAVIWIEGQRVTVHDHEAILLFPYRRERFQFSRSCRTHHGWSELVGGRLDPEVDRALRVLEYQVRPVPENLEVLAGNALAYAGGTSVAARATLTALAQAILGSYLSAAGTRLPDDTISFPVSSPIRRALHFIRSEYASELQLSDIAAAAGISSQHLIRLFRRHVGSTPMSSLWEHRCERAAELVKSTGLSLGEVAAETGFSNAFHLSRRIKAATGFSPRELRKQAWMGTSEDSAVHALKSPGPQS